MTYTEQKLMYAYVMLNQAKDNSDDYQTFLANVDAFVTDARSVTWVMKSEFSSIDGFKEWYRGKKEDMKNDKLFDFFKKLRTDTTHIRPFNTTSKYTTSFPGGGLTITGGAETVIPLGKVDDRGNLVIDNEGPITINGKPVSNMKHSTVRNYFFKDRPNDDAFALCEIYFRKLQQLVIECHEKFSRFLTN